MKLSKELQTFFVSNRLAEKKLFLMVYACVCVVVVVWLCVRVRIVNKDLY